MENKKDLSILVGGAAGEGSRKSGEIIGKLMEDEGYHIFIYEEYPSLITGGHNLALVRASKDKKSAPRKDIDILLALDKRTVDQHKEDLNENGILIYNDDDVDGEDGIALDIETIRKEVGGKEIMKNSAMIAGFAKAVGIEEEKVINVLKEEFGESKENAEIAKRGYEKAEKKFEIESIDNEKKPLITGNSIIGLGAVAAGLDEYLAYPMSPSTGVLHYLAQNKKELGITVSQPENELSVINTALGSAYAGARTMIGTSGGGFALMSEAFSLAAQSETPLVLVESQRMSPASGVPTYHAQGDLLFTAYGGHGDIIRIMVSPGDAEQGFELTGLAMNLAWKYQTPAIVLTEKDFSDTVFSFDKEKVKEVKPEKEKLFEGGDDYKRYKMTKDGISPLAYPGEKDKVVKATSYEKDEKGIAVEDEESIKKMQDKRLRKLETLKEEIENSNQAIEVYGKKDADTAVIVWGVTKGAAKEAAEDLDIKVIQIKILQPLPEKQIKKELEGVETVATAECNSTGQTAKLLQAYNIKVNKKILKYTARPFFPSELKKEFKSLIK